MRDYDGLVIVMGLLVLSKYLWIAADTLVSVIWPSRSEDEGEE